LNRTDGENPYAPPQTEPAAESLAGRSFGWEVVNGRVWVKSSVMFPKIDLYSGYTSGRMVKQKLILRCNPRWFRIVPVIGAMVGALFFGNMQFDADLVFSGVIGYVVGLPLAGLMGMRSPLVTVHYFEDKSSLRAWIPTVNNVLFAGLIFGFIVIPDRFHSHIPLFLAAWLALVIAGHLIFRKLRCPTRDGERFEICGLHRTVVEALEQTQNGRP
jgi:hypothetical protein